MTNATQESLLTDKIERDDGSSILLPEHIKLTLAIATERILDFQHELFAWTEDASVIPHDTCESRTGCTERRHVLRRILTFGDEDRRYHALTVWEPDDVWSEGLCDDCEAAGRETFNSNRNKTWESLPSFFGLPPWTELKDLD
jgi:hypothetical protein